MTKGDLMKAVYTKEQLRHVDSAIPVQLWDKIDTSVHVVDYNAGHGELVNLITRAATQGINIKEEKDEFQD